MEPMQIEQQQGERQLLQANIYQNIPTSQNPDYEDALSYVRGVKSTFGKHSEVYKQFLAIMQHIRKDRFDTHDVIKRVMHLFRGHAKLINGFNLFLPPGYAMPIEATTAQPFLSSIAEEDRRI